jgi:hypothetical protein
MRSKRSAEHAILKHFRSDFDLVGEFVVATAIERPAESEYNAYYGGYIQRVPDGDIFEILDQQLVMLHNALSGLSDTQADYRYAPDQWTIKEVVGHMIDVERIFAYRALTFARNDQNSLPGFEQDDYVRESNYSSRTIADLLQEFDLLRRANLLAFKGLSADISQRCGTASTFPISVRALIYILAGHVLFHMESLENEYLAGAKQL